MNNKVSPMCFCANQLLIASTALILNILITPSASADIWIPDDLVDQVRDQVQANIDLKSLGGAYAAMSNFAVVPDISSATYKIDSSSANDPELSVFKVPLKFYLPEFSSGWLPFLQVNLAKQDLEAGFSFSAEEGVKTDWQTRGVSLAGGFDIPLTDQLTVSPALDYGILDLENDADYFGVISTSFLQPAFENLLFDWDSKARLIGASLSVLYQDQFAGKELAVHGTLTRNYVDSYSESSQAVAFSQGVTTFTLDGEIILPTSLTVFDRPLAIVPQANYTTFVGSNRDQLGFSDFAKIGVAGEIDISSLDYGIDKIRLGLELVKGRDVRGVVLEIGYRY